MPGRTDTGRIDPILSWPWHVPPEEPVGGRGVRRVLAERDFPGPSVRRRVTSRRSGTLLVAAALMVLIPVAVPAQEDPAADPTAAQLVNFAYASQLGTGVYSVEDRTVYVLRAPVSFRVRHADETRWGIRVLLPLTLGLHDFEPRDLIDEGFPEGKLETLTLVPGVQFDKRLYDRWIVRPYARLGAAKDLEGGDLAIVYDVGLKSRLILLRGTWELSLGNEFLYAGATPTGEDSSSFFVELDTGFDARHPMGFTVKERDPFFSLFAIHHLYVEPLEFERFFGEPVRVRNTVEVGFALGVEPVAKIWGMKIPQLGLSYEYGSDFWALRFNVGFPF